MAALVLILVIVVLLVVVEARAAAVVDFHSLCVWSGLGETSVGRNRKSFFCELKQRLVLNNKCYWLYILHLLVFFDNSCGHVFQ